MVVRRKTEEILLYSSAVLFEFDKALNTDQKTNTTAAATLVSLAAACRTTTLSSLSSQDFMQHLCPKFCSCAKKGQLLLDPDTFKEQLKMGLSGSDSGSSPSGGSKALGPVGWNPVIAQSIICLLRSSTDFEVSVSSLSGQDMKALPARLLATYGHINNVYQCCKRTSRAVTHHP